MEPHLSPVLPSFIRSLPSSSLLLLAPPRQPQRLVTEQLVDHAIAGREDGGSQDDTEGNQLRRDRLELAQALGDGVACRGAGC